MLGAGFFAANTDNIGKFLVIVGTGQGLFAIAIYVFSQRHGQDRYGKLQLCHWLTSSVTALGILFAELSELVSKGKGQCLNAKAARFAMRRRINSNS